MASPLISLTYGGRLSSRWQLRLSAGETELEPLLPDRWAASHPEHVLQYRIDESRRKAARQKQRRQKRRAAAGRVKCGASTSRSKDPSGWVMVTAVRARELLSRHGLVQSQPPDDWTGIFPIPAPVERFYQEVGPTDITIESYGNAFFLPRLAALWRFQGGYRWNGLTGQPIADWDDDWLV